MPVDVWAMRVDFTTTDRSNEVFTRQFGVRGRIQSAVVIWVAGASVPRRGQTFVNVFLRKGLNSGERVGPPLARGFFYEGEHIVGGTGSVPASERDFIVVTGRNVVANLGLEIILTVSDEDAGAVSWRLTEDTRTTGYVRAITTADPPAGAEVAVQAVPTAARWNLRAYSVQLVQGITQTPTPTLRIRSAGTTIAAQVPVTTTAIAVSTTSQLTWARGLTQSSFTAVLADEIHTAALPDMDLYAADDIGTLTDGIGANTNYGAALLTVEELIEP